MEQPVPLCCPSCNNLLGVRYGERFVQKVSSRRVGQRKTVNDSVPVVIACEVGDGYWRNPDASDEDVVTAFRLMQDRTQFADHMGSRWHRGRSREGVGA